MGTGSRVVQIAATWREKARPLQPDLRDIAFRYTNIGFVFVVIGFVVQYTHQSPSLIFSFNLLAVFPSSVLLGVGLKSMGHRYGPVIQAVLYMTFGNAVQLITSVILLKNRQIKLLQTSLIGGILSNMHLMLGIGFLLGGVSRMEQFYNLTIAQVYSSLLLPSVTGLVLPTATEKLAKPVPNGIIGQSRTIAIIFLLIYLFLLFFQLKSHSAVYMAPSQKTPRRKRAPRAAVDRIAQAFFHGSKSPSERHVAAIQPPIQSAQRVPTPTEALPSSRTADDVSDFDDELDFAPLGLWTSIFLVAASTTRAANKQLKQLASGELSRLMIVRLWIELDLLAELVLLIVLPMPHWPAVEVDPAWLGASAVLISSPL